MWTFILAAVLSIAPSYFLWTCLHELSHYFVLKMLRPITGAVFQLYPHKDASGTFVWASVTAAYAGDFLSPKEEALRLLAPRFLDALAVVLLPLAGLLVLPWLQGVWMVFWGAGIVDLIVGSIGSTEISDLQRASKVLGWNPWILRVLGWTVAVLSVVVMILVFVF